MERRAVPRKRVLMSGTIEFADSKVNCIFGDLSIAGAALDVINPNDVPERFTVVFKADKVRIPCHTRSARHVACWHFSDMASVTSDVRSQGQSRPRNYERRLPKLTLAP
jgi:hypothetical protein